MDFKPSMAEEKIWIRRLGEVYEFIARYANLVVFKISLTALS